MTLTRGSVPSATLVRQLLTSGMPAVRFYWNTPNGLAVVVQNVVRSTLWLRNSAPYLLNTHGAGTVYAPGAAHL